MVEKLPKTRGTPLAVPFSVRIFKKCIENRIDPALIKHLHFFDLQCILMQFEIQNIERYLKSEEDRKLHARGISEVKDISGAEAKRFLGR